MAERRLVEPWSAARLAEVRGEAPLPARWLGAIALALAAAWTLLFLPQLLSGREFVAGDATLFHGYADFSAARWASDHERTFWNPYVFLGLPAAPSLADPRPQWLPDPLLTGWDALTRGPRGWPLGPMLMVHLLGMWCVAGLALRLWRCGAAAATMAGLLWGYAPGIVVPLVFGHDAQTVTVGLIPVALLAADGVLTAGRARGALAHALGLAAAVALLGLAGHPQFACYGVVALAAFALIRTREAVGSRRVALLAAAATLGLAMAAAVWWPAWLYLAETDRGDPLFAARRAGHFSLAARDLLALGWPRAVGWGGNDYWGGQRATDYANSLGLMGVVFAIWGAIAGFGGRHSRTVRGLLAIVLGATLLSLGPNLPWLGELLLRLPLFSAFRTPSTWMVLLQLAGALVAALGFERALRLAQTRGGRLRMAAAATLALAASIALARPVLEPWWQKSADQALERRGVGQVASREAIEGTRLASPGAAARATDDLLLHVVLLGVAFGVASFASCPANAVVALLAVITLEPADLGSVVVPVARQAGGEHGGPRSPPPLARIAAADPLHRVYPLDMPLLFVNDWIEWRARHVAGNANVPARWTDLRRQGVLLSDGFVRGVAVRYVGGQDLALEDSSGYERIAPGVLARRDALPRAYAVPRVEALATDAAVLDALRRTAFDPARVAYSLETAIAGDYLGSSGAVLKWRRDDPDAIGFDTRSEGAAFVVVADTWFPGWSATLDGAEVPIARVNHVLRGVRVPPGQHRIEMRYRPLGWEASRAVTLLAWGCWVAAAVALALAPRRRPLLSYLPPNR